MEEEGERLRRGLRCCRLRLMLTQEDCNNTRLT